MANVLDAHIRSKQRLMSLLQCHNHIERLQANKIELCMIAMMNMEMGLRPNDVQLLEHGNVWKMEKLPKPIIVNQAWLRRGMV
jgi:hypothetical protein